MAKQWQSPSIEFDFICYLFSEFVSADGFTKDFAKKGDLDWHRVLGLIHHHRFEAVAKRYVEKCPEGAPENFIDQVKTIYKQKCLKNLQLVGYLNIFRQLFEAHDISFIVIKGPLLSQALYGDINTRFSGDLDILIDQEDIQKAHELLLEKGFTPLRQEGFEDYVRLYFWSQKDLAYIYENQFRVEIHTRLEVNHALFPLKMSDWDKYTQMQVYGGNEYRIFKDEIQLIYLAFHGTKHLWQRLFWLLDVAQLSKRFSAEKKAGLVTLSKRFKSQYAFKSALRFADCFTEGGLLKGDTKALEPFSSIYNDYWMRDDIAIREPESAAKRIMKRFCYRSYKAYYFRGVKVWAYDFASMFFLPGGNEFKFAKLPYRFRWGYFALRPVLLTKRILIRGKSL
ncbi:MAG: nucleotidyltransferase family protein [Opitutales bacterium]|nr:nucleotidyltransferase family protein [Opitutales bacterium]